jgi:hypothetical protein
MWDERKQMRLHQLHETEMHGALAEAEGAELAALIEERRCHEAAAIEEAARRTEQANASLEAQAQAVEAQHRALAELIQEQEAYLAEVEAILAQMKARRQSWRERYAQVTGKALR